MLGSIVKASLSNLSNQTALLEACDWNEQEADAVCDYVASFLDSLTVSQETDWNEFVSGVRSHIKQVYGEPIASIIINMIELQIKEAIFYMEGPDA